MPIQINMQNRKIRNCCCCCSIMSAARIIGTLDVIVAIVNLIQVVVFFTASSSYTTTFSFFCGSFVYTAITFVIFVRFPRAFAYLRMKRDIFNLRNRNLYYRARITTFALEVLIQFLDYMFTILVSQGVIGNRK